MPQMTPMNWSLLYLMFLTIFLMMNFSNYFFFLKPSINYQTKIQKKSHNWKW